MFDESKIIFLDSVDSTNEYLKRLGGFSDGTAVIAKTQTAGKGRLGRNFVSPGGGLYMSLGFNYVPEKFSLVTPFAALAVSEAIEREFDIKTQIKWVNDLFYNGKKVCGILCETQCGADESRMIIGIGVNVYESGDLPETACALKKTGDKSDVLRLAKRIAENIGNAIPPEDFIGEYKRRCFVLGRTITVMDREPYSAFAADIAPDGALIVERDGMRKRLFIGEISIKI